MEWTPDKTTCSTSETGGIVQTANQAIFEMQKKVEKGKEIPMSEFAKILIWEANTLKEINRKNLKKKIREDETKGWKVESRTFCGVEI